MIKIKKIFIHFFIFFINYIACVSEECERETPIKNGTNCSLIYCSQNQIKSNECIISNSIIKTQWLNNIILVGEKDFRYVKLVSTSNGELLLSTSSCPKNKDRIYFGINILGNGIFDNNEYIIKKSIERNDEKYERFESQLGLIKINGDSNKDKEYLINIGKSKTYTEIFDYINYEKKLIEISYDKIINENMKSFFGSFLNTYEDNKNYFIIAFITGDDNFVLQKLYFEYDSKKDIKCNIIDTKPYSAQDSRITTCYLYNGIIICAFFSSKNTLKIMIFDITLNKQGEQVFSITSDCSLSFHKLIHLYGDISLFVYYKGTENDYPSIQIIESKKTSSSYSITKIDNIKLDYYSVSNSTMLSDLIKIREDLVCLTSTTKDKESLIIILVNFYNNGEYNTRYYLINIFKLYNHKIFKDMETALYNNNLALAFSFCPQSRCIEDSDKHFSSLIFFSYPNCSDYDFDVISYLNKEENNDLIINLSSNIIIDNNIFGFVFEGIKIHNIDNCGIDFISNQTNNIIKNNDVLNNDEVLELRLEKEEYGITTCTISFNLFITEPNFEEYNKYPNYIEKKNNEKEKSEFIKHSYEGKIGYFNILINQGLTKNCGEENPNCVLCLLNNKTHCLKCQYNYNFIGSSKVCLEKETEKIVDTEVSSLIFERCNIEEIAKGKCPEIVITDSELKEIYRYIKEEILSKNYTFENIIIKTANVQFQLSSIEDQKKANIYISSIDLKDCENKLRDFYKIDNEDLLITFKIDIKSNDYLNTYVQYEFYNPSNLETLNLSICNQSEIIINIPVDLDSETVNLYESLDSFGYNLFDSNDPFYNDICTPYTSLKKTDIILEDRKKLIYINNGNKTLCQNNCSITNYNSFVKKAVCQCSVKVDSKEPDLNDANIEFSKDIIAESFLKTLENSNFLVMQCYKLLFNLNYFTKNIGMFIMAMILLISIILIMIHCFKEKYKIDYFIQCILNQKYFYKNKSLKKDSISISKKKRRNEKTNSIIIHNSNRNLSLNTNNNINKNGPPKINIKKKAKKLNKEKSIYKVQKEGKSLNNFSNLSSNNFMKKKWIKEIKINKIQYLNDHELNNLDYKSARIKDKRTYFQYYWSLLKKKQLILFTFIPANDYNLYPIKYILFLISLSLTFTINGFFFSDETMHKIYIDNGKYDIFFQLAQIIYSTLICGAINTILKCLSLSEKNILEIKRQTNIKKAIDKSKSIKKYLRIKFEIFFIISIVLLIFFWYFISCFCLVYKNTQIILISDTLISIGLSMLYPFGLNFIPGILRILALRSKNKNRKILYKFSLIIALI